MKPPLLLPVSVAVFVSVAVAVAVAISVSVSVSVYLSVSLSLSLPPPFPLLVSQAMNLSNQMQERVLNFRQQVASTSNRIESNRI